MAEAAAAFSPVGRDSELRPCWQARSPRPDQGSLVVPAAIEMAITGYSQAGLDDPPRPCAFTGPRVPAHSIGCSRRMGRQTG